MADYKDIHGGTVQNFAGDPPAPIEGQIWYDSTNIAFQYRSVNPAGSWASGGNLNTARAALGGAGATKDAALAFGGSPPPAPSAKAVTESYNGTSWTEVNDLNSKRAYVTGAGTYTSAIASGGDQYSGTSESWNGTSWTNLTSSSNSGNAKGSAGADNENALFFGGSPVGSTALNEHWDGSSWTELADLNTARANLVGAGGTYTAALAISGIKAPYPAKAPECESFNGTSWTEVGDVNTARGYIAGDGTYTSALFYGGEAAPGRVANAESWNGTAWTEVGDLSTARTGGAKGGAGSGNTNALMFGGNTGSDTAATEEFTSPTETSETITTS